MALIRTGGGVAQASGALGGMVFSHNRGGSYIRARSVPTQPRTSYQQAIRAAVSAASIAWDGLTDAGREAWRVWAQANPVQNRLGDSIRLQGNAAYVQVNARQLFLGKAAISAPPSSVAPSPLLTLSATWDVGAGTSVLTFTPTPLGATEYLHLSGCVQNTLGESYTRNKIRFIGLSAAQQASTFDYQTLVEARFGTLVAGVRLVLSVCVYDSAKGLLSPARQIQGTIVST